MTKLYLSIFVQFFSLYVSSKELKIVNRTVAEIDEYPFMVSLQNNSRHFCGGTLLNNKFVLTAAHCVCSVNLTNFTISLTHFLDNPKQIIPVKSLLCHKNYSQLEHINDIAIVELEESLENNLFKPVNLVSKNFTCENDREGTLIGWGLTETGAVANSLTKVGVIAYNDFSCTNSHYGMYDMEKNMCAGWPENGKGSCQGDSGGPLLIEGFQAGIISFGISSNCGISNREQPKILTRVSEYVDWVQEHSRYEAGGNTNDEINTVLNKILFCVVLLTMF